MDKQKKLRMKLLEHLLHNDIRINSQNISNFSIKKFSQQEIFQCLEYLANEKDINKTGIMSVRYADLTEKGENYLKNLKKEYGFFGIISRAGKITITIILFVIAVLEFLIILIDHAPK
jgi:CTP-dependent riboflavin kinase